MSTLINADNPTLALPTPPGGADARRAFDALGSQRSALLPHLIVAPFYPSRVALSYLGRAERLEAFKAALIAAGANPDRLKLRERALALWHADLELVYAEGGGPNAVTQLAQTARQNRDQITTPWGQALVQWEVLTEKELAAVRGGRSHDDLAKDCVFLGSRLTEKWELIEGKVTFTSDDAHQLVIDGEALMYALAQKGRVPAVDPARDNLKRAFSLVVESVQIELRPGLSWIKRDDPSFKLDEVCPSVYTLRGGGASKSSSAKPSAPAPDASAADTSAA